MGRSGDELFNQVCKWQSMSAGVLKMPLVLRVSVGSKYGAQHSQDWTSIIAHLPGLKAMYPATPYDAKGMLNLALRGTDPVVYFESQRLYDIGEMFVPGGVPAGYYEVPEGEPAVRRQGTDLTIVTVGSTLYRALAAADTLAATYGISTEVIDARFITPLNYGPIVESVKKTGRCVLASDACERGSFLHTMASNISQMAFDSLDAPVAVVGARNWITPAADGGHLLPAEGVDPRHDPRARAAPEGAHGEHQPDRGRDAEEKSPGGVSSGERFGKVTAAGFSPRLFSCPR
jgi:2-oxoisovalerate dehydrogenase E1 component